MNATGGGHSKLIVFSDLEERVISLLNIRSKVSGMNGMRFGKNVHLIVEPQPSTSDQGNDMHGVEQEVI